MTADIKLLPLPELASERVFGAKWDDFDMQDYARANVAHATAAKDAEIERLRALLLETCDDGDEADADLLATLERARTAETRAERLAEALLEVESELGPEVPLNHDSGNAVHRALSAAMAALNQGGGNE